jgi:hypothetical protein
MTDEEFRKRVDALKRKLVKIEKNRLEKAGKSKEIGDRVEMFDCSYNQDIESGERYTTFNEIIQSPMILIEKDCKNPYFNRFNGEIKANRDIVVYSPKYDRKIATCMDCVRLI